MRPPQAPCIDYLCRCGHPSVRKARKSPFPPTEFPRSGPMATRRTHAPPSICHLCRGERTAPESFKEFHTLTTERDIKSPLSPLLLYIYGSIDTFSVKMIMWPDFGGRLGVSSGFCDFSAFDVLPYPANQRRPRISPLAIYAIAATAFRHP